MRYLVPCKSDASGPGLAWLEGSLEWRERGGEHYRLRVQPGSTASGTNRGSDSPPLVVGVGTISYSEAAREGGATGFAWHPGHRRNLGAMSLRKNRRI